MIRQHAAIGLSKCQVMMINPQNETTYLRIREVGVGVHPDERIIGIEIAGGAEVESIAWTSGISDGAIDIGWPVADREDGAILVELPHETSYGAWRIWVKPDQLLRRQRHH